MDALINALMNLFIFAAPFVILYFVIAAAVKRGIDSSETGKSILERHYERKNSKSK